MKKLFVVLFVFAAVIAAVLSGCQDGTGPEAPVPETATPTFTITDTPTITPTFTITETITVTPTITETATFTVTETPVLGCVMFGNYMDYSTCSLGLNFTATVFQKFSGVEADTATRIMLMKCDDGNVEVAIYSDNGGCPDTRLATTGVVNLSGDLGWVSLDIPDTALPAGDYWIAIDSVCACIDMDSPGTILAFNGAGMPATMPTCSHDWTASWKMLVYAACD